MLLSAILGVAVVLTPARGRNVRPIACLLAQDASAATPAEQKPRTEDQSTPNRQGEAAKTAATEPALPAESKQSSPQTKAEAKTEAKGKPKAVRGKSRRKPPAASSTAEPAAGPVEEKVVVRDGGTRDPVIQLTPTMTKQQASEKLNKAKQLLAATESNLKQISARQLGPTDQETVRQIQAYMAQARTAASQGDVEAAHNLALKAQLLSDDLLKR
jgi:hypothetical protein